MTKTERSVLSTRIQQIKPSPTLAISSKAKELKAAGKDIISMSIGEPDFDTPQHIKEAAIKAINEGHTKYTAVDGIKPLKQAIISKFKQQNSLDYQENQIIVSSGAKQSLYIAISSLINPGDEVIVIAPYWVSYPDMVKLCEGTPVIVTTSMDNHCKVTPEQIKQAITPKTKAIIFNSPSNPTGLSYSEQDLKVIGDVLLEHEQITVITDDIYEHSLWKNTPFKNIVNACPNLYDRTIVVNGVSKSYAMTGWRIGYAAGPAELISAMKKAQSQSTSNPCSISQYAAVAALTGDQACVQEMTKAYQERHDYLYKELSAIPGITCTPSDGTFYIFPSVAGLLTISPDINSDLTFADYLLREANIAVVPGSAFGAPGHIRISYATSMDNCVEAIKRIKAAVEKLNK